MKSYKVGFIPHPTLSVWSAAAGDVVSATLLRELGPLPDTSGGKNAYGQWCHYHAVRIRRVHDRGARLISIEVPESSIGSLMGTEAAYEQYCAGKRWFERLERSVKSWSQDGCLRLVSDEAVEI